MASLRPDAPEIVRSTAASTVEAARSRLRRWGLTAAQIRSAEKEGVLSDHVTINAPLGGTVIQRQGQEGMYVETGTPLFTIADLSKVWVLLEAYESDLLWLHYGQPVTFTTEAYPGDKFQGTVSFINPVLNPGTRTVSVRVNVDNPDGRLKPDMFVRAEVHANIAAGGRVMDTGLAGKWICPMHPEIIKGHQDKCDVCGMALVTSESLGYVTPEDAATEMPLLIPATAPLVTGKRAIAYVELPDSETPTFEGREIALGPRAGDYYLVAAGLEEGERVVTNGNFKIDSALQLLAKPSMMAPAETAEEPAAQPKEDAKAFSVTKEFQTQLGALFNEYAALQTALANDDAQGAAAAAKQTKDAFGQVDMALLKDKAHLFWMKQHAPMKQALDDMTATEDITAMRVAFEPLSDALTAAVEAFGAETSAPIIRFHCPMALEDGAYWLQNHPELLNPYYGEMMLNCGTTEETLREGAPEQGPSND